MLQGSIQTDVYLKLLEERHAATVFAVVDREREHLRRWLPWVDKTISEHDTREFIRTSLQQFADNEGLVAGIWCKNEFAGTIGTHKIDWLNRKVEIGYWIAARFQGKGIVTDACRALIDHAFRELELNRVEIHCAEGNLKSCAIPKRLGFEFEGVRRQGQFLDGRYLDIHVYAILARDWRNMT
jgi:ribosomal-protein-serine acetyltransferase